MSIVVALVLFVIAFQAFLFFVKNKKGTSIGGIAAKPLLTDNELEFFHRLQRALPDFHVFPQVAANAILQVSSNIPRKKSYGIRAQFSQKHVDFVVCEQENLQIRAIIELDDRTHKADKDKKRDAMFEQAGYRVIRFQSKKKPSESEIAALFKDVQEVILSPEPPQNEPALVSPEPIRATKLENVPENKSVW